MMRRYILAAAMLPLLARGTPPAYASKPQSIALFGFTLDNTSPAASTPDELARTLRLGQDTAAALQHSGRYVLLTTAPVTAMLHGQDIRNCNGCELGAARKLGSDLAAYGWVQKVSNLILNINIVIEDCRTGRMVAGGSVDIRGNTDESWNRGLKFLLEEHVFPQ